MGSNQRMGNDYQMGEFTQLVYRTLDDDDILASKFLTYDQVLDFLRDYESYDDEKDKESKVNNFSPYEKSLLLLLKEIFFKAGLLNEGESINRENQKALTGKLYHLLRDLDRDLLRLHIQSILSEEDKTNLVNAGICQIDDSLDDCINACYRMYINREKDKTPFLSYCACVLNEQIKNDLVLLKQCEENDDDSVFVDRLCDILCKQSEKKLSKIHIKNLWRKVISSKTPQKWLNGKTKAIDDRETAIKICYVLHLSYEDTRDFLNKCGFSGLSIRNEQDAVHYYCLLKKRSYYDAQIILNKYEEATSPLSIDNSDAQPISEQLKQHTGHTTHVLLEQFREAMQKSSWETDDDFLTTFLIPNKRKFISYSITTLYEYYKLKNPLYFKALKKFLSDERDNYYTYKKDDYKATSKFGKEKAKGNLPYERQFLAADTGIQVTLHFISKLKLYSTRLDFLQNAYNMLDINVKELPNNNFKVAENIIDVLDYIVGETQKNINDIYIQSCIAEMLTDMLTAPRFLQWISKCLFNKESGSGRQTAYSQSVLSDHVLKNFPHRTDFSAFENNPKNKIHNFEIRNIFVLLFFIQYSYDWAEKNSVEQSNFGFHNFFDRLNTLLGACHLGFIYPPNRFDWLICRCIRENELFDPYEDIEGGAPLDLFRYILEISFGYTDLDGS